MFLRKTNMGICDTDLCFCAYPQVYAMMNAGCL
uniref:Uncharacterized protein n=1 Tax=Anguilla anguilla TaxID=7936 RepID=A0A0E9TMU1_ANGAN